MLGNGDIFEDASNALFIGGNQIVIDINTDYGMLTSAFTHEAYHYLEENNKRAAAEMKKLVFDMLGDEGARKARKEMRGRGYAEEYVDSEIVADSLFDVLSRKGLMKQISKETRMTVSEMLLHLADGIRDVLMRFTGTESWRADMRKQMRNYELLSNMFEEAMTSAADDVKRAGLFEDARGERRASFKGYALDGRGKYESNFPKGTPKKAKAESILKYIQNVWSKKPIRLKITEDGKVRYIDAEFDPTYDESGNVYSDATKLMGGNRHGKASEQRVTLDLADDYYRIASESKYNFSKDETGKNNPAHKDVLRWHYFINDIYFSEYGEQEYSPYRVSINVKERADGDFVYSFSAEKEERLSAPWTLHATVNSENKLTANAQSSINSISHSSEKINPSEEKTFDKKQSKKKTPSEIVKEYESPITPKDVETLRSIGRKSVNSFTGEDIQKASKWAHKFYKELGTKSPFFRAWFGEYRAHEKTPVKIATIPEYIATNEARKANRGTVKNSDTGWDIRISREGETNTISHAGDMRLSEKGLSGIRELIENAVLLDSEVHEHHSNNSKNDLVAFDHKLYVLGKDTSKNIGLYRITIEDAYHDSKHQSEKAFHNLKYIEKVATVGGRTAEQSLPGVSTNDKIATIYSIADVYNFVKTHDNEFKQGRKISPQILESDGTPKVFYHGTADTITEFQEQFRGKNTGAASAKKAYFFTDNKKVAAGYAEDARPAWIVDLLRRAEKLDKTAPFTGRFEEAEAAYAEYEAAELAYNSQGNVMPVYLGLENPLVYDFGGKEYREVTYNDLIQKAKNGGHDGVVFLNTYDASNEQTDVENTVAAVFNSEQIKSATDNIGTFDKKNKDIRFSKKKEPPASLKAEDVFGSDYRKEYTSLKAEAQGLRNALAEVEGNGELTGEDRVWRIKKLRDILEAKENTMKRMDNMREILAQMQTVNKNSRRYAKLFMNALATVRMTGTYRSVGDSWEVSKTLSEITDTYEPTLSELMSDEGLKKLQKEHKQIYDAFMEYVRDKSYLRPFDRKDYKKVIEAVAKEYKAVGVDTAMLASEVKNAVEVYLNKPSDIQGSYESLVRELDVILSDITDKGKKLADSSPWAQSVKGKTVKLVGEQYSEVINTFGSLAEANRYMNGAVTFSRVRGITLSEALDGNNAAELLRACVVNRLL